MLGEGALCNAGGPGAVHACTRGWAEKLSPCHKTPWECSREVSNCGDSVDAADHTSSGWGCWKNATWGRGAGSRSAVARAVPRGVLHGVLCIPEISGDSSLGGGGTNGET